MTIERKLLGTSPSGGATDVADVFSTFLYTGNGGTNVINNGIDLAGEGGMVWIKCRNVTNNHYIVDTERGASKLLYGLGTAGETTSANSLTSFNSNGFTLGADDTDGINKNTRSQVAWTFRKKEKFFDVVTWTGNGADDRQIAHSLNSAPAMMLVKRTDSPENWAVYHKNANGGDAYLKLDITAALDNRGELLWGNGTNFIAPTSTVFTIGSFGSLANANGGTYVAYLFADNSSEDAEDQMIKCGSYTEASGGVSVNLGWEPQWLLIKTSSEAGNWWIIDKQRGWTADGAVDLLAPNTTGAEIGPASGNWKLTSTGFESPPSSSTPTYIWMAIRGPMMVEPEAATEVFAVDNGNGSDVPAFNSGFPVDMAFWSGTDGGNTKIASRLTGGKYLETEGTGAEQADTTYTFDHQSGWYQSAQAAIQYSWIWKRAKGYMDCVAYSGSGANRTLPHSLGVVPEMIWVKARNSGAQSWRVYNASSGATHGLNLNGDNAAFALNRLWNDTAPTNSSFTVGNHGSTNDSSLTYIAYLFATLAGISKVGSYTGNGSYQTINCGFSAGARFILIKRTNAAGNWYVWDSLKGIVAGNDPHFQLNTTAVDVTNDDSVDPHSSGFIVNQNSSTNINVSSGTYIFYAIA